LGWYGRDLLTFRFNVAITIWVSHIATEAVASGQVITHKAFGILATTSGAGIAAFLIDTGQLRRTIGVEHTLRTTSLVGISEILRQTLTGTDSILLTTLGKGAAGIRIARLHYLNRLPLDMWFTTNVWIAAVSRLAVAHGTVTNHSTHGISATKTWARVPASVICANMQLTALGVGHTFGSTVGWGSKEVRQAGAGRCVSHASTFAVRSTW